MGELTLNELARQQIMQPQQGSFLSGLLGGTLGGQGLAQQQFACSPLGLSNVRANLWPENKFSKVEIPVVTISFFDRLREEIDEWLKP